MLIVSQKIKILHVFTLHCYLFICKLCFKSGGGVFLYFSDVEKNPHSVLNFFLFILGRGEGREKEKERNIDWLPCMCPDWGPNPQPTQTCALTGNQTGNLSACKMTPNQLSHTGWDLTVFLNSWTPSNLLNKINELIITKLMLKTNLYGKHNLQIKRKKHKFFCHKHSNKWNFLKPLNFNP